MLVGLAAGTGAAQEDGVGASGGAQGKLVERDALTCGTIEGVEVIVAYNRSFRARGA